MSEIKSFRDYERYEDYVNRYNRNRTINFSEFFGGGEQQSSAGTAGILSDYAAIRNGSYGRLLKAHFANVEGELAGRGDTPQKLTLMKTGADCLRQSADALNQSSLWEKKKIRGKDDKTGEETVTEDYDWKAITKAVRAFIDDYNDVVKESGESDTKGVLRQAMWMTNATKANASLLGRAGITIGKGNQLKLDEDALKSADISTLRSVFCGFNSYAGEVSRKAAGISNAANRVGGSYTRNGAYANVPDYLLSKKIDEEA